MKIFLTLLCACLFAATGRAQFYAPETEYHDVAQRRFPVEAARVLAWLRNAGGAKIAEVTYRVETTAKHETVWTVAWLDAGQAVLRTTTVRYPEEALAGGAAWYHSVWQQLEGKDWTAGPGPKAELAAPYWEGAGSAGLSRMSGCTAALKQLTVTPKMEQAPEAAKLAGTLTQAALPVVGTSVSLDGSLLSRAAAWLCRAEERSGASFPAGWGPILMLAGREGLAKAAWKGGTGAGFTPVERFWDVFIRFPSAKEALPFISTPTNRPYAGPLFIAYGDTDTAFLTLFGQMGKSIVGDNRWNDLHDYAVAQNVGAQNTYPLAAHGAPGRSLAAWVQVLGDLPPGPGDAPGAAEAARLVKDFEKGKHDVKAPSPELLALLNRALTDSAGPLAPTAVLTARDVLCFGWEQGGQQLGNMAGATRMLAGHFEEGKALAKTWAGAVAGWDILFGDPKLEPFQPLADTGRYEFISSPRVASALIAKPPQSWGSDPAAYFRRRWLNDASRGLEYFSAHGDDPTPARQILRRMIREGGQRSAGHLLSHGLYNRSEFEILVDQLGLREELATAVPANLQSAVDAVEKKFAGSDDTFAHAQALERLTWDTGLVLEPAETYLEYLRANATVSAKRYYDRIHGSLANKYDLEAFLGPANFAVALLENDPDRMKRCVEDCTPTFVKSLEVAYALQRDDLDDARKHMEERVRMGDPRGVFAKVRDYLALVPALKNPADPKHREAVESFPATNTYLFVQWVLYARSALSEEEGVRFFGGDRAADAAKPMIAAIQKKSDAFTQACQSVRVKPDEMGALYAWLHNRVAGVKPPSAEPDLMPEKPVLLLKQLRDAAAMK